MAAQPTVEASPPPIPVDERNTFAEWMAGIFIGLLVLLVAGFVWKNSRTDA